jgi:hypothetical protein
VRENPLRFNEFHSFTYCYYNLKNLITTQHFVSIGTYNLKQQYQPKFLKFVILLIITVIIILLQVSNE